MHAKASLALRALKIRHRCGRFAARKYASHRGVLGLYRLAQQLEATKYFFDNLIFVESDYVN